MGYRPQGTQPGEGHEGLSAYGAFRRHRARADAGGGRDGGPGDHGSGWEIRWVPSPNIRQGQPNLSLRCDPPTHCLDAPNQGNKTTQKPDCRRRRNQDPAQMSNWETNFRSDGVLEQKRWPSGKVDSLIYHMPVNCTGSERGLTSRKHLHTPSGSHLTHWPSGKHHLFQLDVTQNSIKSRRAWQ